MGFGFLPAVSEQLTEAMIDTLIRGLTVSAGENR